MYVLCLCDLRVPVDGPSSRQRSHPSACSGGRRSRSRQKQSVLSTLPSVDVSNRKLATRRSALTCALGLVITLGDT